MKLERIVDLVTDKDLSTHNKIINLWLDSGNKREDFPKLPPCWFDVLITLKNGKKYKAILAEINRFGGCEFVVKTTFKGKVYIETGEVIDWKFIQNHRKKLKNENT